MSRVVSSRGEQRAARLLAALAETGCALRPTTADGARRYELRVEGESAPRVLADAELVAGLVRNDWLRETQAGLFPTETGLAFLRRLRGGEDPWRAQHLAIETGNLESDAGERRQVAVVANESPLTWLRRRRGADGQPLVTAIQYQAGERLRADFERGRLSPRLGVDWTRPAIDRHSRLPGGSSAELLDSVIAARRRVEAVLQSLGPDLGGLLIDVCCYLTGLEDAERRRGWSRRSAKVVLAIALDRLAAHYGLSERAVGPNRSGRILHWGEEGYRPTSDGESATCGQQPVN
jgi:Domain of unknown function (DUF6456)